jgi:hypothetical protein
MMSIEKVWLLVKSFCLSNLGHEDPIAKAATALTLDNICKRAETAGW